MEWYGARWFAHVRRFEWAVSAIASGWCKSCYRSGPRLKFPGQYQPTAARVANRLQNLWQKPTSTCKRKAMPIWMKHFEAIATARIQQGSRMVVGDGDSIGELFLRCFWVVEQCANNCWVMPSVGLSIVTGLQCLQLEIRTANRWAHLKRDFTQCKNALVSLVS